MSSTPEPRSRAASPEFDLAKTRQLSPEFFNRDTCKVAREILGKVLVRKEVRGKVRAGRIVEVEAYLGENDPAAHSASGPTKRNLVLFGPPGHVYVYFIYGNHYCLNFSCEPDGRAGGILVRALEPLAGVDRMYRARGLERRSGAIAEMKLLTSGPGRLAEAFDITRDRDNDKDVTSGKSDLIVVDDGFVPEKVATTPRVGITKAVPELLRYVIDGNPFVSPTRPGMVRKKVRTSRRGTRWG